MKKTSCHTTVYNGLDGCGKTSYIAYQHWVSLVEANAKSPAAMPAEVKPTRDRAPIAATGANKMPPVIPMAAPVSLGYFLWNGSSVERRSCEHKPRDDDEDKLTLPLLPEITCGISSTVVQRSMAVNFHSRSNANIKALNRSQCTGPNFSRASANTFTSSVRSSLLTEPSADCGRCTSGIPYVSQSDSMEWIHTRISVFGGSYSSGCHSLRIASSARSDSWYIS